MIAITLVTIVVYLFLRSFRATAIPSVAVPVSILGTFGAMYLLGYSLDILSLMALTIATGFVVDDAIVVLENISRHLEAGMPRLQAALLGAREVGFTVLSISLSLIAVFLPILLMGGILGRLFREFTMTLSLAIMISLVISLTTTPMMCALFLRTPQPPQTPRRRGLFDRVLAGYEHSLAWALQHSRFVLFIFFGAIVLNVVLFAIVPKGFFPEEDTGRLIGSLQADQSVSFQLMTQKLRQMMAIVQADPAVEHVVGYTGVGSGGGFGQINTGSVFVSLKPIEQRPSMDQVIARLRPKLAQGARRPAHSVRRPGHPRRRPAKQRAISIYAAGRRSGPAVQMDGVTCQCARTLHRSWPTSIPISSSAVWNPISLSTGRPPRGSASRRRRSTTRFTTPSGSAKFPSSTARSISITSSWRSIRAIRNIRRRCAIFTWRRPAAARREPQQSNAPAGTVSAGKAAAANETSSATAAANANNNSARNAAINALANSGRSATSSGAAVSTAVETMVPLAALSHYNAGNAPLSVSHQGLFVASTISFNLQPGAALGDAANEIDNAIKEIRMPASIHGSLAGTAQVFAAVAGR